jgi:hypothetical protein
MKALILRWQKNCRCNVLDECGRRLLLKKRGAAGYSRRSAAKKANPNPA